MKKVWILIKISKYYYKLKKIQYKMYGYCDEITTINIKFNKIKVYI